MNLIKQFNAEQTHYIDGTEYILSIYTKSVWHNICENKSKIKWAKRKKTKTNLCVMWKYNEILYSNTKSSLSFWLENRLFAILISSSSSSSLCILQSYTMLRKSNRRTYSKELMRVNLSLYFHHPQIVYELNTIGNGCGNPQSKAFIE